MCCNFSSKFVLTHLWNHENRLLVPLLNSHTDLQEPYWMWKIIEIKRLFCPERFSCRAGLWHSYPPPLSTAVYKNCFPWLQIGWANDQQSSSFLRMTFKNTFSLIMCVKEWAQVSVGAHNSEEGIGSSGATLGLWWALETQVRFLCKRNTCSYNWAIPSVASSDVWNNAGLPYRDLTSWSMHMRIDLHWL